MNILITGGADGIALEAAKCLSKWHHIYLTVHKIEQIGRLDELLKDNKNIEIFKLDITNKKERESINNLDIDVLINNAAIGESGSIIEIPIKRLKQNFEVNVFSSFALTQLVLKQMIKKKRGKIIIISSLAGIIPIPFLGSYSATKASISILAKCLYKEMNMLNSNIKVILMEFGSYFTGFNQYMIESRYSWLTKKSYFKDIEDKIYYNQKSFFDIIESKNLDSAVCKIVKVVNTKNPKFKYRSPLMQSIFARFYMFFSK